MFPAKTEVITLVNDKLHRQSNEPIKSQIKYMQLRRSAGKRVWTRHDSFWFYFWLDEKMARVFFKPIAQLYKIKTYLYCTEEVGGNIETMMFLDLTVGYFTASSYP